MPQDAGTLNQRAFRQANVRLGNALTVAGKDGAVVPFLCECADDECLGRIELSHAQYDDAHLLPNTYVILFGHLRVQNESVIEEHGLFDVVQKVA